MFSKLMLCDFARASNDSFRYDAIGAGLKKMNVSVLPAPIMFSLLLESKFENNELGKNYPIEIIITDTEGKQVGPVINGNVEVGDKDAGLSSYAVFNIQFFIKKEALLTFSLKLNGVQMDVITLEIIHSEKKNAKKKKQKNSKG